MNRADAEKMAEGLRGRVSMMVSEVDELRTALAASEARNLHLSSRIDAADRVVLELRSETEALRSSRSEADRRVASVASELVESKSRMATAEREVVGVRVELEAEREQNQRLSERLDHEVKARGALQVDYNDLTASLRSLSTLIGGAPSEPSKPVPQVVALPVVAEAVAVKPATPVAAVVREAPAGKAPIGSDEEVNLFGDLGADLDQAMGIARTDRGGEGEGVDAMAEEIENRASALRTRFAFGTPASTAA